jgi:hypothetical protein
MPTTAATRMAVRSCHVLHDRRSLILSSPRWGVSDGGIDTPGRSEGDVTGLASLDRLSLRAGSPSCGDAVRAGTDGSRVGCLGIDQLISEGHQEGPIVDETHVGFGRRVQSATEIVQ